MINKISFLICLAVALTLYVPIHPLPFAGMLDGSWMQIMHEGFIKHWQWGGDIVFTIGPWGFLYGGYMPETHALGCVIWASIAVIFIIAGAQVSKLYFKSDLAAYGWLLMFTIISNVILFPSVDSRGLSFALLFILAKNDRIKYLLTGVMGFLSLIHISLLVTCSVVVLIESLREINTPLKSRFGFPFSAAVFGSSVILFWLLACQNPMNLPSYLFSPMQVVGAYGDAMSTIGNAEHSDIVIWFLCCGLLAPLIWMNSNRWQFASLMFIIFTAFKHGFIRHDGHELTSSTALVLVAMTGIALNCRKI